MGNKKAVVEVMSYSEVANMIKTQPTKSDGNYIDERGWSKDGNNVFIAKELEKLINKKNEFDYSSSILNVIFDHCYPENIAHYYVEYYNTPKKKTSHYHCFVDTKYLPHQLTTSEMEVSNKTIIYLLNQISKIGCKPNEYFIEK